jgi:hypothetical protein
MRQAISLCGVGGNYASSNRGWWLPRNLLLLLLLWQLVEGVSCGGVVPQTLQ